MDKKPPKNDALREQGKGKKPRKHSNAASAQRQRLLAYLRAYGMIDTITARKELDLLAVAPRIFELRHRFGHQIDTLWTEQQTDCGQTHRVALYVLCPTGEA